jgi:peptidoglycan/LPS O-acetylase OafA/YrhL
MLIAWQSLAIFKPLDFVVVRFYGRISYSLYLLHVLGILFANRLAAESGIPISEMLPSIGHVTITTLTLLITTPAAYLGWRFIEMPCIMFGRRIGGASLEPATA